jgi:phage/conjugal plasmid C-4 type zinc finger TraR family protein
VTDFVDRATDRADVFLRQCLEEQRRTAALGDEGDWQRLSAEHCVNVHCGDPIPEQRRRALPGVRLCLECAVDREKSKKAVGR